MTTLPNSFRTVHRSRRPAAFKLVVVSLIAALCLIFGAAMLWTWLNPSVIAQAQTFQLLALLGLFLLPVGVLTLERVDRRLRPRDRRRNVATGKSVVHVASAAERQVTDQTAGRRSLHRARPARSGRGRSPDATSA